MLQPLLNSLRERRMRVARYGYNLHRVVSLNFAANETAISERVGIADKEFAKYSPFDSLTILNQSANRSVVVMLNDDNSYVYTIAPNSFLNLDNMTIHSVTLSMSRSETPAESNDVDVTLRITPISEDAQLRARIPEL